MRVFFIDGVHVNKAGFQKWLHGNERSVTFDAIHAPDEDLSALLLDTIPSAGADWKCQAVWLGPEPSPELKVAK
jgi:hypothetical protein